MRNDDYVFASVLSLTPRFFQVRQPAPHPRSHTACEADGVTVDPSARCHQSQPVRAFAAESARAFAQDRRPTGENIEQKTSNGAAFRALSGCKSRQTAIYATICQQYSLQKNNAGVVPAAPRVANSACHTRCAIQVRTSNAVHKIAAHGDHHP